MAYLSFISDQDLYKHVKNTLETYGNTIKSINLKRFNKNIIDPIKLTFDSKVYDKSFERIILDEITRQRDKTNTNAIGYFHQNIFKYIANCEVPAHGFDVIFTDSNGIKTYVELKNKHNTMNASSSQKTYMKLSSQALQDPTCTCCLVEVIAKKSQDIKWSLTVDGTPVSNARIRRISIDKFYERVTGINNAFYQMCDVLPTIIEKIISENEKLVKEEDTVIEELRKFNPDLLKAIYLLAFSSYEGF